MKQEDKTQTDLLTELQRLQQENESLQANDKFKSIFLNMASGCCFDQVIYEDGKAIDYRILDINPAYEKILGIKRADVVGKLASEIYKTKNIPFFDIYARVAETGIPESFEAFFEPSGIFLQITSSQPSPGMFSTVFSDISQRKQTEAMLREKETQYRNLANSGLALIWTSGTDKLCNYFNETWLQFTGRTLEQEMGNGWAEGVHPDDFDYCLNIYTTAFDKHEAFEMEYRLRHNSGEYRWLLDMGTPNYNSNGAFIGYIGHCFDITERKKAENEFRSLAESMPQIVWITDPNGLNTYFNHQWVDYTGLTLEESYGEGWIKPFHPDDQQRAWDAWQNAVKNNAVYSLDCRLRRADGQYYWWLIRGVPQLDANGNILKWFGTCTDIAGHKLAEEKLLRSEHNLSEAERIGNTGSWEYDVATDTAVWSENMFRLFDVDPQIPTELVFKHFVENLVHPDDRQEILSVFADALGGKRPYDLNYRIIKKNGSIRIIHAIAETLFDENARAIRLIGKVEDITERKHFENSLQESERKLSTLMGNLYGMAYRCKNEKDWPLEYVSKGCLELTGYTDAELLNQILSYNDLIDPDYQNFVFESVQIALSRKESFSLEYTIHTKDGQVKWVMEHGCGIFSENDEIIALEGFITDISDRKKAEDYLFESEERFRALHNASFGGIAIHDKGIILECNQGLIDMMGYTQEELIGMDGLLLIAPDSRPLVRKNIASGYEKPYEAFALRKNGEVFPIRLEARNIPYKGKQVRTVEFRDITEAKQAEEALMISNQKFQSIFNNLQDAFFQADLSGNFTLISPSAPPIYGYASTEEMMGMPAVNLYADASQRESLMKELYEKGIVKDFVGQAKKKDGSTFWVSMNVQLTYQNGKVSGTEGVVRDITERKQAEEALAQSRAELKAIYDFSPVMMCLVDENRKIIFANPAFTALTGTDEALLQGGHACGVFGCINATDDIRGCGFGANCQNCSLRIAMVDTLANGTIHVNIEHHTTLLQNGKTREVSLLGSTVLVKSNGHRKLLLCLNDITERKQAEKAIKESEEKYSAAFHTSPDAISLTNLEGEYIDINEGYTKMFGYTSLEIIGRTSTQIQIWAFPSERIKFIEQLKKNGIVENMETVYVNKDKKQIQCLVSAKIITINNLPHVISTTRNITAAKQSELALKESEEKFRQVFESANVGKSITLLNGELNVNRAFCDMLGYSPEELKKKKWQDLTPTDEIDSIQKETETLLKGEKKSTRFIKRYIHKNGSFIWADVSFVLHTDTNNKPLFFISTIIDITERKQIEEELHKSESKYSALFNTMQEGFALHEIICDANGRPIDYRFLDINPAFERLTGLKKSDVFGKTVLTVMPDTEKFWIERYGKVALTGKPILFESFNKTLEKYYQVKAFCPAKNQFAVIFTDITYQKQNEEKIARHSEELSKLNQFSIDLASLSAHENIEEAITKKIKEMSGAETSIFSVYNTKDRTLTVKEIDMEPGLLEKSVGLLGKQIKKMQTQVDDKMYIEMTKEVIGVRQSLHEVSFGSIPRPIAAGLQALLKVDRFVGIAYMVEGVLYGTSLLTLKKGQPLLSREILENFINLAAVSLQRRRAEESLKESEEKYRTIFNNVQDVFYQTNLEGIVLEISPSIKYFTEFKRDEILGHPVENLYNDPKDREPLLKELMQYGELKDYELKLKTREGVVKHVSVNARLIRDNHGNPHHIDGSLRDINDRKQIEIAKEKEMHDMKVFHSLTINRELKMIELKREINELAKKIGEEPRYNVPEI